MPDPQSLSIPFGADQAVRCSRCGSDAALHFDEVTLIDPAGDVIALHADGGENLFVTTAVIGEQAPTGGRHMIVLPHWCDACGERGEIVLQQENGRTLGRYRDLSVAQAGDSAG